MFCKIREFEFTAHFTKDNLCGKFKISNLEKNII